MFCFTFNQFLYLSIIVDFVLLLLFFVMKNCTNMFFWYNIYHFMSIYELQNQLNRLSLIIIVNIFYFFCFYHKIRFNSTDNRKNNIGAVCYNKITIYITKFWIYFIAIIISACRDLKYFQHNLKCNNILICTCNLEWQYKIRGEMFTLARTRLH